MTFWSLFTLLQGFAVGLKSLLLFRFGLGISEAPCFPVNSRVVATWFPQHERARATGIYTVGEYLGLACFAPALFWIMGNFGWRALFIAVGVLGITFGIVWWLFIANLMNRRPLIKPSSTTLPQAVGLSLPAASRRWRFRGATWDSCSSVARSRVHASASSRATPRWSFS